MAMSAPLRHIRQLKRRTRDEVGRVGAVCHIPDPPLVTHKLLLELEGTFARDLRLTRRSICVRDRRVRVPDLDGRVC